VQSALSEAQGSQAIMTVQHSAICFQNTNREMQHFNLSPHLSQ